MKDITTTSNLKCFDNYTILLQYVHQHKLQKYQFKAVYTAILSASVRAHKCLMVHHTMLMLTNGHTCYFDTLAVHRHENMQT